MIPPMTRETGAGEEAVERAVREHAGLVYRIARAVLRNHHDAEDAAQEVFLRVLRLRRGLEGVENVRTWLARVAFRVALDRRSRPRHVSLDDATAVPVLARMPSPDVAADEIAAARQVRALVAEKVDALPGDLRHAVRLSTVAELSSPEIAVLLGIPEGTVRTRLMRARRILRVALAATVALSLAVGGGVLLRKREREREREIPSKGEENPGRAPAEPAPLGARSRSKIASKGAEAAAAAGAALAPLARTAASSSHPSKKIFFPSPVPLSEQERLLVEYVSSTAPAETAARSGFLDEPAALPALNDDPPSN